MEQAARPGDREAVEGIATVAAGRNDGAVNRQRAAVVDRPAAGQHHARQVEAAEIERGVERVGGGAILIRRSRAGDPAGTGAVGHPARVEPGRPCGVELGGSGAATGLVDRPGSISLARCGQRIAGAVEAGADMERGGLHHRVVAEDDRGNPAGAGAGTVTVELEQGVAAGLELTQVAREERVGGWIPAAVVLRPLQQTVEVEHVPAGAALEVGDEVGVECRGGIAGVGGEDVEILAIAAAQRAAGVALGDVVETISAVTAGDRVGAPDIIEGVIATAAECGVVADIAVERRAAGGCAGVDQVVAIAAVEVAATGARNNGVIAVARIDIGSGRACGDGIVALAGIDLVVVVAADDGVVAVVAIDRVVAGAGVDRIIAPAAIEIVAPGEAGDGVVAGGARDRVVAGRAGQGLTNAVLREAVGEVVERQCRGNDAVELEHGLPVVGRAGAVGVVLQQGIATAIVDQTQVAGDEGVAAVGRARPIVVHQGGEIDDVAANASSEVGDLGHVGPARPLIPIETERVLAAAAGVRVQGVVIADVDEDIIAAAASQDVGALIVPNRVVAATADQGVVAAGAVERGTGRGGAGVE